MSGIIKSVVGLFTLGRSDFADISMFRDELSFRLALELERVPSEETLRQRLDLIAKLNSQQTLLDYAMRDLLRKVESFGTVKIGKHKLIPLDIDVAARLNPDLLQFRELHTFDTFPLAEQVNPSPQNI